MNGTESVVEALAVPVAVALGAACVGGILLLAAGLRRWPARSRPTGGSASLARRLPVAWCGRRLGGAVCTGVVTGALTGWPVGGALAAVGAVTLPGLLGPDREAARRMQRMEAIATWTEMLRDTLSAAAGLEQALQATAEVAPPPLRKEVRALAGRIRGGQALPEALEAFAGEVDDAAADTVVTVLRMASQRQAAQLAPLLGSLADAVREQVAMRQRVAAERMSTRTSVRVCCATTFLLAVGLVCFNRPYLEPFNGPVGQLALAVAGGLFAASFAWLHSIAAMREAPRLLADGRAAPAAQAVTAP
ncbi:type II secretion system F family protein [Streptomyces sp. NBC_01803]|uniref:type II secretion system F family protein n=1 Tax=Streptomyces sp. NBC_01803 TaxID=2975946 RepID=UPI002DD84CCF|nr:type II secretion system F family protein [Streptomyces sp. NBC_01803]WSA44210.1 type II secretion system F family protein [Streptomyces sp. NBC_01803]